MKRDPITRCVVTITCSVDLPCGAPSSVPNMAERASMIENPPHDLSQNLIIPTFARSTGITKPG